MRPNASLLASLAVLFVVVSGCTGSSNPPGTSAPAAAACSDLIAHGDGTNANHTKVQFVTAKGNFSAELFDEKAPITVANFKKLVDSGFYSELLVHRIIKGFMVQTGGMKTDGTMKESPYGTIKNEALTSKCLNKKFTLSMARGGGADTASNQFFVNTVDNCFLDASSLSPCPEKAASADGYAVFGIVYAGRDVVQTIENTPVTMYTAVGANKHCQADNSPSCPKSDVILHSIKKL